MYILERINILFLIINELCNVLRYKQMDILLNNIEFRKSDKEIDVSAPSHIVHYFII